MNRLYGIFLPLLASFFLSGCRQDPGNDRPAKGSKENSFPDSAWKFGDLIKTVHGNGFTSVTENNLDSILSAGFFSKSDTGSGFRILTMKDPGKSVSMEFTYLKGQAGRDSLVSGNIKTCEDARRNFKRADTLLLHLLNGQGSPTKYEGDWNYTNLAESVYNRDGYSWILDGGFGLHLGWDNSDTNCIEVSIYGNSDGDDEE
ncbi:MAG: hypothetical protein JWP91_3037 [Fibrobacteres bacterium]|nr:hypothetical protein [Fibrobacterota bacterium]